MGKENGRKRRMGSCESGCPPVSARFVQLYGKRELALCLPRAASNFPSGAAVV